MKTIRFAVRRFINRGKGKVSPSTRCGTCTKVLERNQDIVCHAFQSESMPAPGFHYFCEHCAPQRGSGWGEASAGKPVTRPQQVKVGDVLLHYSCQFASYNVVRVTETTWPNRPEDLQGKKFNCIFIDPSTMRDERPTVRQSGDQEMCVWDHEMAESQTQSTPPTDISRGGSLQLEFYRPIIMSPLGDQAPQGTTCGRCSEAMDDGDGVAPTQSRRAAPFVFCGTESVRALLDEMAGPASTRRQRPNQHLWQA